MWRQSHSLAAPIPLIHEITRWTFPAAPNKFLFCPQQGVCAPRSKGVSSSSHRPIPKPNGERRDDQVKRLGTPKVLLRDAGVRAFIRTQPLLPFATRPHGTRGEQPAALLRCWWSSRGQQSPWPSPSWRAPEERSAARRLSCRFSFGTVTFCLPRTWGPSPNFGIP